MGLGADRHLRHLLRGDLQRCRQLRSELSRELLERGVVLWQLDHQLQLDVNTSLLQLLCLVKSLLYI